VSFGDIFGAFSGCRLRQSCLQRRATALRHRCGAAKAPLVTLPISRLIPAQGLFDAELWGRLGQNSLWDVAGLALTSAFNTGL